MSGSGLVQQATPCGLDGVRTERGRESRGTSATRPPPRRGPGGLPCTCVGDCRSCDCAHRPHWASGCPWGGRSTWSGGHLVWEQKGRLVIYRAEHRAGYGGAGISQDDGGMPHMGLRGIPRGSDAYQVSQLYLLHVGEHQTGPQRPFRPRPGSRAGVCLAKN